MSRDGRRLDRARIRRALGEPADQEGGVNEPREQVEAGLVWNERWIYRRGDGPEPNRVERVVLFRRYDFVGSFRIREDGSPEAEDLADVVAGREVAVGIAS